MESSNQLHLNKSPSSCTKFDLHKLSMPNVKRFVSLNGLRTQFVYIHPSIHTSIHPSIQTAYSTEFDITPIALAGFASRAKNVVGTVLV